MTPTITDIRTILLRVPLDAPTELPYGNWVDRRNLIVVVETSTGVRGAGEIWINVPVWSCEDRRGFVSDVLKPLLVGEPLDDPKRFFAMMVERTGTLARRWHAPGPVSHAIAGVDIALWDAHTRHLKRPLRDVLSGGDAEATVSVYASGVGPASIGKAIEKAASQGHTSFKIRLVSGPELDRQILHEARDAAGDRALMTDPAETYTPDTIMAIWDDLILAQTDWLEEPFPNNQPEMYDALRRMEPRPRLALGESTYGLPGLAALVDRFKPEVVQPDITKTGGLTEGMEAGRMTVESGCEFGPHMLAGPIGFAATANLVAATSGARMLEMDCDPVASFATMMGGVPTVTDGTITLSGEAGHGTTVDEDELARLGFVAEHG
jgi:L-alanine-DL-glutamate epimerase-like enolase superfamily enzyme